MSVLVYILTMKNKKTNSSNNSASELKKLHTGEIASRDTMFLFGNLEEALSLTQALTKISKENYFLAISTLSALQQENAIPESTFNNFLNSWVCFVVEDNNFANGLHSIILEQYKRVNTAFNKAVSKQSQTKAIKQMLVEAIELNIAVKQILQHFTITYEQFAKILNTLQSVSKGRYIYNRLNVSAEHLKNRFKSTANKIFVNDIFKRANIKNPAI